MKKRASKWDRRESTMPSHQRRWMLKESRSAPKCHACRTPLKGPHVVIGELHRCYWCNKRIAGG